jgi:hypothetical protein
MQETLRAATELGWLPVRLVRAAQAREPEIHRESADTGVREARPLEQLSPEQRLACAWRGGKTTRQLVLIGEAGTGKSECIAHVYRAAAERGAFPLVLATTHLVCSQQVGMRTATVASLLRPGASRSPETFHRAVAGDNFRLLQRRPPAWLDEWRAAGRPPLLLVVDEIGRVTCDVLQTLSHLFCMLVGRSTETFGGASVLAVGDVGQLRAIGATDDTPFVLAAPAFRRYTRVLVLREVHRANEDDPLRQVLAAVRRNRVDPDTRRLLDARVRAYPWQPGGTIPPDALTVCSTNRQIDEYNARWIRHVGARDGVVVHAHFEWPKSTKDPTTKARVLAANGLAEYTVVAPAMRVRLTTNNFVTSVVAGNGRRMLFNNATGTVVGVDTRFNTVYVRVRLDAHGDEVDIGPTTTVIHGSDGRTAQVTVTHLPMVPFYACTVHRLQGVTLDTPIAADPRDLHEPGAVYTVFSRVRRLEQLHLTGALDVDPETGRVRRGATDHRADQAVVDFVTETPWLE